MEHQESNELLQRDKEIRATILNSLFGRVVWIDAGAVALILAGVVNSEGALTGNGYLITSLFMYSVSLLLSLFAPVIRYLASFDRSRFSIEYLYVQCAAILLTFGATLCAVWALAKS